MKSLLSLLLAVSLLCFTSCTTLTNAERCAKIGQIQEGTTIATSTGLAGNSITGIYSYTIETHNPICKFPKTKEEKATVANLMATVQVKKKNQNIESLIGVGFSIFLSVVLIMLL